MVKMTQIYKYPYFRLRNQQNGEHPECTKKKQMKYGAGIYKFL